MPELQQVEEDAQAVILAYDTELTYHKLARSALLLQKPETLFLATHPDLVCPSPEGPLPDVGSMIELYATATAAARSIFSANPTRPCWPLCCGATPKRKWLWWATA